MEHRRLTTLNINGRRVKVDDSFRSLSPEDQERTVNEIASQMGAGDQRGDAPVVPQEQGPGFADTAMDMLKAGGAGFARGASGLAGLPGTLADLGQAGLQAGLRGGYGLATGEQPDPYSESAVERFFAGPIPEVSDQLVGGGGNPISGQALQDYLAGATGGATSYQAQTTPGKYAGTVGEFIPGAMAFGGINPSNILTYGVAPGLASEGAGQLTEGTPYEPYARIAAALAAPMAVNAAGRVISPYGGRISPERMQAAETLRAEGVNPTAGQLTGSRNLLARESELGGARAADMMDDQARAFTEAAMRRSGQAGTATPENMAALNQRLGQGFTDISARNTLRADQGLATDMNRTMQEYGRLLPTDQRRIVGELGQDIVDRFRTGAGSMPGQEYQTIRSRLGRMAQSARQSDPEYASALRGMRNALDDAMSRSVAPEDAATWAQLRREYGNMKVLEKAATGAGAEAAAGNISPAKLRQAAVAGRSGQYARGEGDFDALARAGNLALPKLPDSGTATRLNARTLGGLGGVIGAGGGAMTGDPLMAMAGALAGSAAPAVAGRALMSRPVQSWLTNQLVDAPSVMDPRMLAVVQSLLGQTNDEAR